MTNWTEKYKGKQVKYTPKPQRLDELMVEHLRSKIDRCNKLLNRKHCSKGHQDKLTRRAEQSRVQLKYIKRKLETK